MERTLLPGDFILVNKFAYNVSTPKEIPFIGTRIPYLTLFEYSKPDLNDVVIFDFKGKYLPDSSIADPKLVKRIVACPGDTLLIKDKKFFVNQNELELPISAKRGDEILRRGWAQDGYIYPPGAKWNKDNYGPIILPKIGDTIKVTARNFERWKQVIVMDYGENVLRVEGSVVTLDGRPITEYVIKKDHYFVIGDNLDISMDSRYFGFVTDDLMIGEVLIIYWSMDFDKVASGPLGFLSGIRIDRVFRTVQ
jgi:signal peptidase I